jgi:outer membrane protein assembly factor BamB
MIKIMLLSIAIIFAADWPQFKRTPDRQGCNLAEQVSLPANLCAWVDFHSPILASPAVVDDRAYCISSRGILACIDLPTHSVVWYVRFSGVNNQSSPAVGNGKVYVGSTNGNFYVVDAASGSILKTVVTGSPIFTSPLLTADGVYFGNFDGTFYALDLDGNEKWTFTQGKRIQHAAAAFQDQIVFADGDDNMFWLRDNTTQAELVRSIMLTVGGGFSSSPMIWNNSIYIGKVALEYNLPMGLNLYDFTTGVDTTVGDRVKLHTTASVDTLTGNIFTGYNQYGLECRGTIRWNTRSWTSNYAYYPYPEGVHGVNSSPAVIDSVVVFGSEQGKMHFFQKNNIPWPRDMGGINLWSYETPSKKPIHSSPAVSNGKLVFGSLDGHLYGLWGGTEVTAPVIIDTVSVETGKALVPGKWTLSLFPNPTSNGIVNLKVKGLARNSVLCIYNAHGALVKQWQGRDIAGNTVQWNCTDLHGKKVSNGNYFAVLKQFGQRVKSFNIQILR